MTTDLSSKCQTHYTPRGVPKMNHRLSAISVVAICALLLPLASPSAAQKKQKKQAKPERREPDIPFKLLTGHTEGVSSMAFFPGEKRIVSGSFDKTVRIFDLATGTCERTLEGHTDYVWSVAVSRDGKYVASGSADHTARVWDAETGEQLAQLEGHTGRIMGLGFLPNGKLITGGGDGKLRLWDWEQEKELWQVKVLPGPVYAFALSEDGKRVATSTTRGWLPDIHVMDVATRRTLLTDDEGGYMVQQLAFSPDGNTLYEMREMGFINRWNIKTKEKSPLEVLSEKKVSGGFFALSADARTLVGTFTMGRGAFELPSGRQLVEHLHMMINPNVGLITKDGKHGLTAGSGTIQLWKYTPAPMGNMHGILYFEIPRDEKAKP
jgi:WD40 repeat protein